MRSGIIRKKTLRTVTIQRPCLLLRPVIFSRRHQRFLLFPSQMVPQSNSAHRLEWWNRLRPNNQVDFAPESNSVSFPRPCYPKGKNHIQSRECRCRTRTLVSNFSSEIANRYNPFTYCRCGRDLHCVQNALQININAVGELTKAIDRQIIGTTRTNFTM